MAFDYGLAVGLRLVVYLNRRLVVILFSRQITDRWTEKSESYEILRLAHEIDEITDAKYYNMRIKWSLVYNKRVNVVKSVQRIVSKIVSFASD